MWSWIGLAALLVLVTSTGAQSLNETVTGIASAGNASSIALSNASADNSSVVAGTFMRVQLPVDGPETARAQGLPPRKTVVRDDIAECYQCDSYTDPNKCRDILKLKTVECEPNQHTCHYIVGEVNEGGRKENVVFAGCDVAPAVKLPMISTPITHTASDGVVECREFAFRHSDLGSTGKSAYGNVDVGFSGTTCSCNPLINGAKGCNRDYTKLLKNRPSTVVTDWKPNSAAKSAFSVGIILTATIIGSSFFN